MHMDDRRILAFLLLSRSLCFAFISVSLPFLTPRSTSRCRQLATRGLGCDHKRINPSDRTCGIRRRCLAERSRMAMRAAAGRRRGNNVAEFILFFFPRQSRLDHEHDLPGRTFTFTERLYSVPISRRLEGTIDRPSRMNAILSQFSSASVDQGFFFFRMSLQFYKA